MNENRIKQIINLNILEPHAFRKCGLIATRARVKQIYRVTWGFTGFLRESDFGESGEQC